MTDLLDLLDLLEDWTDAAEWVPLYIPDPPFARKGWDYDCSRAEWDAWMKRTHLCRDCGTFAGFNQGGSSPAPGLGSYMVCDGCAELDRCLTRQHDRGPEWHVSHWGTCHRVEEHDQLALDQERRRARYRKKHPEAVAA